MISQVRGSLEMIQIGFEFPDMTSGYFGLKELEVLQRIATVGKIRLSKESNFQFLFPVFFSLRKGGQGVDEYFEPWPPLCEDFLFSAKLRK